ATGLERGQLGDHRGELRIHAVEPNGFLPESQLGFDSQPRSDPIPLTGVTTTEAPEGGRLRRPQAARRERVIGAGLELAAEGGYDAIQVRAIADRTGISSDTIYRYFGSRDRLIGEAVGQWSDHEFYEPAPTWLDGETAAEQLLAYYRQVWAV